MGLEEKKFISYKNAAGYQKRQQSPSCQITRVYAEITKQFRKQLQLQMMFRMFAFSAATG